MSSYVDGIAYVIRVYAQHAFLKSQPNLVDVRVENSERNALPIVSTCKYTCIHVSKTNKMITNSLYET